MHNSGFGADRRRFMIFSGALALAAAAPFAAQAQDSAKPDLSKDEPAAKAPMDLLMAAPPLPDVWLGDPKAPVTIIEYGSMTCSHCADFEVHTFPLLKANYIDKGKVRFAFREFPLDPLAAAAAMLARCSGDKREAMIELLYQQQKNWAFVDKPLDALRALVKQTGIGDAAFDACLKDQALFENVDAIRDAAAQKFGINSTPTFFINGDKKPGEITPDALDATLAPYFK